MKSLTIYAVIMTILGFFAAGAGYFYSTKFARSIETVFDPKYGPIQTKDLPRIRDMMQAFVDAFQSYAVLMAIVSGCWLLYFWKAHRLMTKQAGQADSKNLNP